jgi:hypothetical protein
MESAMCARNWNIFGSFLVECADALVFKSFVVFPLAAIFARFSWLAFLLLANEQLPALQAPHSKGPYVSS